MKMNLHSILSKLVIMLIQKLIRAVILRLVMMLIILIHLARVMLWLGLVLKLLGLLFRIKSTLRILGELWLKMVLSYVNKVIVIGTGVHLIRRQLHWLAPFVGQLGFLINGFGKNKIELIGKIH